MWRECTCLGLGPKPVADTGAHAAGAATALVGGDLAVRASGPQSARPPRHVLLRRVVVEHKGERHQATLRNLSQGGAMIEGLWSLGEGSVVRVEFTTHSIGNGISSLDVELARTVSQLARDHGAVAG